MEEYVSDKDLNISEKENKRSSLNNLKRNITSINKAKKRLCYISYETFYHADKPVLPLLATEYEIVYCLIEPGDSLIDEEELSAFSKKSGITSIRFHHKARRRNIKQLYYYLRLLLKVLSIKSDINFFVAEYNIYFSLLAPFFLSTKSTTIAFHDVLPHKKATNILKDLSVSLLKSYFKKFHFFSETQMKYFESRNKSKKCSFTPLILTHYGQPLKANQKTKKVRFLFFGGIKYYKGIDVLLKACEELYAEGISDFTVTIAGDGDYWEECKGIIKAPALYNLEKRFIDDSEIPEFFSEADFLVLPYRDVTQSGPLAIAHYYNVPAIASSHAGFIEHIEHGYNGYIFKNEDVSDLKSIMLQVISQPEEEYFKLKNNLEDYTKKKYSLNEILKGYKTSFEE